jgi:hypothetical protein
VRTLLGVARVPGALLMALTTAFSEAERML